MVGRFRVMSESEAAVDSDERGEASQHQTGPPRRTASNHVWKKRVPHQKRNRVQRGGRNQHRIRIFTPCFVVRSNDADDAENEQPTANEQPEGTRIAGRFQLLQTGAFTINVPFVTAAATTSHRCSMSRKGQRCSGRRSAPSRSPHHTVRFGATLPAPPVLRQHLVLGFHSRAKR